VYICKSSVHIPIGISEQNCKI